MAGNGRSGTLVRKAAAPHWRLLRNAAVRNCVYGPQSAGDAAEVQPLIVQTVQPTDFTLRLAAAFGQTQQRGLRYQSAREGP
jgi:hypothetical protein